MSKRIIVEGPDGTGKSTLIRHLISKYSDILVEMNGYNHLHNPPYFQDWISDTLRLEFVRGQVPIHNRFFYSELVYGPILRKEVRMTNQFIAATQMSLRYNAFLVYCTLPYEDLVKSATLNPQMEGVVENLRDIYRGYNDRMGQELPYYWGDGRCVSFNYKRQDYKEVTQMVGEYLNQ